MLLRSTQRLIVPFAIALYLLPILDITPAYAESGSEGAAFLQIPVGARPAALGSAYSALAEDAYAPIWNPAGLSRIDSSQIAGQHLSYLESIRYEYVGIGYPLANGRGIGLGVQYLGSGDIPETDRFGNMLGTFSSHYAAYSLAYGHRVGPKLSLGITGKLIEAKISDVGAHAWAMDFGGLYHYSPHLRWAGVLSQVGTKLKFLNEGDSLPLAFRVGAAYDRGSVTLLAEGVFGLKDAPSVHTGVEWNVNSIVQLRAGYRTDTVKELSPMAGVTTGIGLRIGGQEFSYAWLPMGDLGNTQYFSVLIRFGNRSIPKRPIIQTTASPSPERDTLIELLSQDEHSASSSNTSSLKSNGMF
jgi:hypothetical protein